MKRFAAYDPPEYLDWTPDESVMSEFRDRLDADPERSAVIRALDQDALLGLYGGLVRNRLHDIALKRWVKQGVISKAWLGTGEEAATIGPVHALRRGENGDVVAPMIRNAGACHEMGMSLFGLFRGVLATEDGPNGGRDGHLGDLRNGVIQPISHVGDVVPVTAGVALAFRQRDEPRVALTWIGDGSTKTAAFHEGVNLAAVWKLPMIVIIQNNQVALGTKLSQHAAGSFAEWPAMYGMTGGAFDGNNVLDAYAAVRLAAERARSGGGPTMLVAETFRMGGHATHDEREARALFPADLFAHWGRRDPVGMFEAWLEAEGISRERLAGIEAEIAREVDEAAERAATGREGAMPAPTTAAEGVWDGPLSHRAAPAAG